MLLLSPNRQHYVICLTANSVNSCDRVHFPGCVIAAETGYSITDPAQRFHLIATARCDGFTILEQLQASVHGIAVPINNRHAKLADAINLGIPIVNESRDQVLHRILPILQKTANSLLNLL